ncbi:hypothetical protein ACH5RR_004213 [Cinchona calisaya]|uniref:Uncharacterized protein n=1 Tax=Cinchona calisaya TaxID=153742 RepID=A0ABD3AXT8_9GENT
MFMIWCTRLIKAPRRHMNVCNNVSKCCRLQWSNTSSLLTSSNCWARPSSSLPWWSSSRLLSNLKRSLLADENVVSADQFLFHSSTTTSLNSKSDFVRLIERSSESNNDDMAEEGGGFGNCQLQTALVSYRPTSNSNSFPPFGSLFPLQKPFLQVDLVSTIHMAEKEYFETLQNELELYDCVLYEMVVSRENLESTRNSPSLKIVKDLGSCGFDTKESIQRRIATVLKLDFQLDCIDYQSENWFHADLDLETYDLLQQQKGEIPSDKMHRWTKAIVQVTSMPEDLDPLISQASYCAAMKVFLAKLLKSELTGVTTTVEERSVINGERNKAAIEALRRAIDEGHKKIAIVYGVGHMPDLGQGIREEFDLVPYQVQWITAWSIKNYKLKTAQEMDLWLSELFSGTLINELSDVAFNHLSQSHGSEKLWQLLLKHIEEQRRRKAIEPCCKTLAKMNALENELSKLVGLNELRLQLHKWTKGKTITAGVLGKVLHTVGTPY